MSDAGSPDDIVVLGKVVGPYGLLGAVRVHPFADDPLAWAGMAQWWVGHETDAHAVWKPTKLLSCKEQGGALIVRLECIPDRNASESCKGLLVGAPRELLPRIKSPDEFYWADLVGLDVVNTKDEQLGRVLGLIETPANDVLRVGDGEAPERLLPFVKSVVLDVSLADRRMRVEWEADW